MASSNNCIICSDNVGNLIKNNLCNNNCQFYYHINCYAKWQKTSSNKLCIMCRKPIISFLDDDCSVGMGKNEHLFRNNHSIDNNNTNNTNNDNPYNEHVAINVRRHFNFNNPMYYYDEVVYADDINVDDADDSIIVDNNIINNNTHFTYHTLNGGRHEYRLINNRSNELGKQFCKIFCCIFFLFPLIYQIIYLSSERDDY